MGDNRIFAGGEFLITDVAPEEVFTPEDFRMQHARQFNIVAKYCLPRYPFPAIELGRGFSNYPEFIFHCHVFIVSPD